MSIMRYPVSPFQFYYKSKTVGKNKIQETVKE